MKGKVYLVPRKFVVTKTPPAWRRVLGMEVVALSADIARRSLAEKLHLGAQLPPGFSVRIEEESWDADGLRDERGKLDGHGHCERKRAVRWERTKLAQASRKARDEP